MRIDSKSSLEICIKERITISECFAFRMLNGRERGGERRRERERDIPGSGTALPQGRTPNLGHNTRRRDVARPFPRRRPGAAVTPRDYSRFRNNNYLIPEVHNAQPGWNAGPNRRKEEKPVPFRSISWRLPRAGSDKKRKNILANSKNSLAIFEPRADSLHRKVSISRLSIVVFVCTLYL